MIVLGTTKVVNHAKSLEICNWLIRHVASYNQTGSFCGWALDFIGQIHPTSSKGHRFMLVGIDYFTKCMEVVPLKNIMHKEVIHFILEHIVHRFMAWGLICLRLLIPPRDSRFDP
jgi:hypothetical protein